MDGLRQRTNNWKKTDHTWQQGWEWRWAKGSSFFVISGILAFIFNQSQRPSRNVLKNKLMTKKKKKKNQTQKS